MQSIYRRHHHHLGWSIHVDNITNKSSNTLNFLRRNLNHCPKQSNEVAYFAMVRSTLEYSSAAWDPISKRMLTMWRAISQSSKVRDGRPLTTEHYVSDAAEPAAGLVLNIVGRTKG